MDLTRLKIDKLKNVLKNEGGIIPNKGSGPKGKVTKEDLIKAIILQRPKYRDYMTYLAPDITRLLSINLSPKDIPALCQTNTNFRNQCLGTNFWINYLSRDNMTPGQTNDLFSDIMIEVALEGDIELYSYLWKKKLIINGSEIIKERKTLYDSYMAAVETGDKEIADYIYSLNPEWLEERLPNIDFYENREKLEIQKSLIDAIEGKKISKIANISSSVNKLLDSNEILNLLSLSSSFDSLKFYYNILFNTTRGLKLSEITYIFRRSMAHYNIPLVESLISRGFHKIENIGYNDSNYLDSSNPDSYILLKALYSHYPVEMDHIVAKNDYFFGNERMLMDYVENNNPSLEVLRKIMIKSLGTLSNDNYLKLFQKLINTHLDKDPKIINSLEREGRDFLLNSIMPIFSTSN